MNRNLGNCEIARKKSTGFEPVASATIKGAVIFSSEEPVLSGHDSWGHRIDFDSSVCLTECGRHFDVLFDVLLKFRPLRLVFIRRWCRLAVRHVVSFEFTRPLETF